MISLSDATSSWKGIKNKEKILRIQSLARGCQELDVAQRMAEIEAISNEILEEL